MWDCIQIGLYAILLNQGQMFSSPIHSSPTDLNFMQCLFQTPPSSTQTIPLRPTDSLSTSSSSSAYLSSSPPQPDKLPSDDCLCRARLMLLSPKIHRAIQDQRLDEVFKVTGDIIKSARNTLDCARCEVSYADLICILAVFQQTNTCWEHLTEIDLFGGIRVSVGKYEVPIVNNTELRRMLILDLIKQARMLLDSLRSLGQNVSLLQHERGRLTQVNLSYLQAVIENFTNVFGSIINSFDAPRSDSVGLLRDTWTR